MAAPSAVSWRFSVSITAACSAAALSAAEERPWSEPFELRREEAADPPPPPGAHSGPYHCGGVVFTGLPHGSAWRVAVEDDPLHAPVGPAPPLRLLQGGEGGGAPSVRVGEE